jgi:hypothetical protein
MANVIKHTQIYILYCIQNVQLCCVVLALNDSRIGKSRQKAAPGRANSTSKEYYSIQ